MTTTSTPALSCQYHRRGICHSCTWLDTPYEEQLRSKQARAQELLEPFAPAREGTLWKEPFASLPENFRNKVKLAVTGTVAQPQLGILTDTHTGKGADLRECPLPTLGIREALPVLARFVTLAGLQPYNMHTDEGVLKYLLVTESPSAQLMVRFVVRRRGAQGAIFKHYSALAQALPALHVCSINVQPERKAIIEGEEEILVTPHASTLSMNLTLNTPTEELRHFYAPQPPSNLELTAAPEPQLVPEPLHTPHLLPPLNLELSPGAFFQTNTEAAQVLYRRAKDWLGSARTVWDLYCGVGGFGLALALGNEVHITGVETHPAAVAAAQTAAQRNGVSQRATFINADALEWVRTQTKLPDAIVINPPRRGIGQEFAEWINSSGIPLVLYSSCNIDTLARDASAMANYTITCAQVVDMFAQTPHFETVALFSR